MNWTLVVLLGAVAIGGFVVWKSKFGSPEEREKFQRFSEDFVNNLESKPKQPPAIPEVPK